MKICTHTRERKVWVEASDWWTGEDASYGDHVTESAVEEVRPGVFQCTLCRALVMPFVHDYVPTSPNFRYGQMGGHA